MSATRNFPSSCISEITNARMVAWMPIDMGKSNLVARSLVQLQWDDGLGQAQYGNKSGSGALLPIPLRLKARLAPGSVRLVFCPPHPSFYGAVSAMPFAWWPISPCGWFWQCAWAGIWLFRVADIRSREHLAHDGNYFLGIHASIVSRDVKA